MIPRTRAASTTLSRPDLRQYLPDLRHVAVTKFHKEVSELTGYTHDRWDLRGVPCSCPECTADYETLRVMQRTQKAQVT